MDENIHDNLSQALPWLFQFTIIKVDTNKDVKYHRVLNKIKPAIQLSHDMFNIVHNI